MVKTDPRPSEHLESALMEALQLMVGPLAPTLAYQPWLTEARAHLEQQAIALLDLLAETAEHDRRLDDAIRVLLDAVVRDPLAEDRYLTAARLLAEQGRRSRALALIDQARSALADAGLRPTAELGRLEDYLRRDPLVARQAS